MYAIINVDGGRQFRVEEGQQLVIDYRDGKVKNDELVFDRVVACGDVGSLTFGAPNVAGASVVAKVVGHEKGPKLTIQKIRRRKNVRRRTGHRGIFTRIEISKITAPSAN